MSFLRKFFRGGTQPLASETPLSSDDEQPAPKHVEEADTPQHQEDMRPGDSPSQSAALESPEDTTAAAERAGADAEDAWWEEAATGTASAPLEANGMRSPLGETAPLDAAHIAEKSGDADGGTGVAGQVYEAPSAADDSLEVDGTRPLTTLDAPALVALRSRQGFATAALRDIGRVRSINQDSVFALTTTLPRESSDVSMGLFVVADGMGGHAGGEIASRMAISTVVRHVLAELVVPALADGVTEALQPLLIAAVQEANRAIWEHAQAIGSDMGTTCTVALLLGQALYIGHVGDTRAYLITPTGMRLITNDHSTVGRLIQLGQLDPTEAREHPLRSQLYRTVGQHPEVLVDFIYQPIGNATHLLMCSDGLWSMLDEEVLSDVLEHTVWPHDACRELIARANLAGGEDNISAVVVTLPRQT